MKLLLLVLLLLVAIPAFTQQDSVKITTPGDTVVVTETWTVRQLKQFARQQRRDSIRAHKKVWLSILGGPSYNPEASLGVGGAMLMTFRMNPDDTISQRSFIPVGFNISINGTFVAAGAGTLFSMKINSVFTSNTVIVPNRPIFMASAMMKSKKPRN